MGPKATPSPYRWIVLAAYMLIALASQIQWVALAPVSRAAEHFYAGQVAAGSFFGIDFLAMLYLILYLVMALPASFIIDTYGLRVGLGIGAALAGAAGLAKGLFAQNFTVVLIAQVILAVSQPFILNAATTLGARWFPLRERGLAVGFASLAQYLGIVAAMVIGPALVDGNATSAGYGRGVGGLLLVYGIATAATAIVALLVIKEGPVQAVEEEVQRLGAMKGLRSLFASRDYRILLALFTIGLGIFNTLSAMVDTVAAHIGVNDSDGLIGTFMILGGILGALALPAISDAMRRRKPFLVVCMGGMVPGVACLAFAGALTGNPAAAYTMAKLAAGILGFFVMSAGPIGFQYAAEIGRPAPESTSQGLLLLVGQISGIAFMALMGIKSLAGPVLIGFVALSILSFLAGPRPARVGPAEGLGQRRQDMKIEGKPELEALFRAQGEARWAVAASSAGERIGKLKSLRAAILARQEELYDAVWKDYRKPPFEAWLTEIFPSIEEIDYTVGHLRSWMRDRRVKAAFILPTREELSPPRAQGPGPHHVALELPLPAPRRPPGVGHRGGKRGHREALEQDPRDLGLPGLPPRGGLPARGGGGGGGKRGRPGRAPPGPALRPRVLHGQPAGRRPRGRGRLAHARRPDPGAGRQVPDRHPARCRHRGRGPQDHVGKMPERRPDLHRPGLPPLPAGIRGSLRGSGRQRRGPHVRDRRGGPESHGGPRPDSRLRGLREA